MEKTYKTGRGGYVIACNLTLLRDSESDYVNATRQGVPYSVTRAAGESGSPLIGGTRGRRHAVVFVVLQKGGMTCDASIWLALMFMVVLIGVGDAASVRVIGWQTDWMSKDDEKSNSRLAFVFKWSTKN